MPRVPTTTGPEVLPSVVSPAFQSGAGATVEAFGTGRGLLAVGEGISQTSDLLSARILEEQAKDNERYAKQLDTEFQTRIRTILYGDGSEENPGFTSQLGENAIQSRADVQKAIEAAHRELLQQANQNPRVRDMFGISSGVRINDALTQIARHTSEQRQVANEAATLARIELTQSEIQSSNGDPEIMAKNLALMSIEVQELAEQRGLGEEAVAQMMQEAQSKALAPMIEQVMIDDPMRATALYEANKALIDGVTRADLEKKLFTATLETHAQALSDEARAKFPGNVQAQRDYIKQVSEGKLESTALDTVEAEFRFQRSLIEAGRSDESYARTRQNWAIEDQAAVSATGIEDPFLARMEIEARRLTDVQNTLDERELTQRITEAERDFSSFMANDEATLSQFKKFFPEQYLLLEENDRGVWMTDTERMKAEGRDFANTTILEVYDKLRTMAPEQLVLEDLSVYRTSLTRTDWFDIESRQRAYKASLGTASDGREGFNVAYNNAETALRTVLGEEIWKAQPGTDNYSLKMDAMGSLFAWVDSQTTAPDQNAIMRKVVEMSTPIVRPMTFLGYELERTTTSPAFTMRGAAADPIAEYSALTQQQVMQAGSALQEANAPISEENIGRYWGYVATQQYERLAALLYPTEEAMRGSKVVQDWKNIMIQYGLDPADTLTLQFLIGADAAGDTATVMSILSGAP